MDRSLADTAAVEALRLGIDPNRVSRFRTQLVLEPQTLVIRRPDPAPLVVCLHPADLTEFQFAHALRGLACLNAHLAFPCALHAHEVDLGGAFTVGYAWYHYTGDNPACRASLALGCAHLERVLKQLRCDLPIERRAIFMLGAGDGALMAALFACRRPDQFAGVIAIGGQLRPELFVDGASEQPPLAKELPILWLRPARDRHASKVSSVCDELRALRFRVELELVNSQSPKWDAEERSAIAWLAERSGIAILEPNCPRVTQSPHASSCARAAGGDAPRSDQA